MYEKKIPLVLLNARITKKSFKKWNLINFFSKKIFNKISLSLASSYKSRKYLKKLGARNIKLLGNLKYSQSESDKIQINKKFKKFISSKKVWCASSNNSTEEL